MLTVLAALHSCSSDDEKVATKDMEKPQIVDNSISMPVDCETYFRGDTITFQYEFTDNAELGNFNIEIHNNFDHHTHSTSAGDCKLDEKKAPIAPWVYNQDFAIPAGQKSYTAKVKIPVPMDVDPGDYHFMVRLTDKSGWQQLKAISIKLVDPSNAGRMALKSR